MRNRIAEWISDVILGGILGLMILMAGIAFQVMPWFTVIVILIFGGILAVILRKKGKRHASD